MLGIHQCIYWSAEIPICAAKVLVLPLMVLKCVGDADGWLWECPCRRVEHLSFILFLMSLFAVCGGCIHACWFVSVRFDQTWQLGKLSFSLIAGLRGTISSAEAGGAGLFVTLKQLIGSYIPDLIAIIRRFESQPESPCHPTFWPMCLRVAVSRRLNKSRLPLRKMKLPHPRSVLLLYWVFRCFSDANQCVKDDFGFSRESKGRTVIQWQDQVRNSTWIIE